MKHDKHNLQSYVRRALTWRILLLSIICAFGMMGAFYHLEEERTLKRIVERATYGIDVFNTSRMAFSRNPEPFTEPGLLQYEFDQFMHAATDLRRNDGDRFIVFRLHDRNLKLRAAFVEHDYPDIARLMGKLPAMVKIPLQEGTWHQVMKENGLSLIHIVVPVFGFEKGHPSYFEGLFYLSEATLAEIRTGAWRAAIMGLLIVIATVVVIYPVVRIMADRLSLLSQSLLESNLETLQVLGSAIAKKDSDTNAHNFRVTIISVRLAEKVGLSTREIRALIKGAFLHDIGKIGIADDILLKPGKLDDKEYEIMKTHVTHGTEIISRSNWLTDSRDVVHHHHEQIAGSGYPDALKGENIPVNARIFAIVDVFDALTASRPYKKPFSYEMAMDILNQSKGSHFDSDLLEAFTEISEEIYANLANREEGLEDELDVILKKYFPGGKEDLEDAERLRKAKTT